MMLLATRAQSTGPDMSRRAIINSLEGMAWLASTRRPHQLGQIVGTGCLCICAAVACVSRVVAATAVVAICLAADPALAQKHGGTLRVYISANPSSLSILEEVSFTTVMAAGPVFNGLVVFDPTKPIGSIDTVIPELAESWSWDENGTSLTFKLRQGVKWHDGKPFTAKDVQCTWHWLNGKIDDFFRKNPRRVWWTNLLEVTINGDHEVTFHLARPQPSMLALLGSGFGVVYPCHVTAKDQRTNPIGTGPFKFVEFKSNERVRLVRNPQYWKQGLPYLDAIDYTIVGNRSTRVLGLIAGAFDLTTTGDITVPIMNDIASQAPQIVCTLGPTNVSMNVLVNDKRPPFDNLKLRQAMALALDRDAFVTILSQGASTIAGNMMPPPEGLWGMLKEKLEALAGYRGPVEERRARARKIMEELGYDAQKKLGLKVSTRDLAAYKDAAVIFVDQLNQLHFAAELEIIESSVWFGRAARQDYWVALNLTGSSVDDPDATLVESYACDSEYNFTKYCNPEVTKLLEAQSAARDVTKRREIVWEIERILNDDVARPVILHGRSAQCRQPYVRGHVRAANSIYSNWRHEQVWLDK
jgi:peptide/nickel transport system substrate-binding protein